MRYNGRGFKAAHVRGILKSRNHHSTGYYQLCVLLMASVHALEITALFQSVIPMHVCTVASAVVRTRLLL